MKTFKLKIAIIALILLLSIPAAAQTSGSCGAHLTWSYANRVLTISGYGDMTNYDNNGYTVPWSSYSMLMTTVVLPEGITSIGTGAFAFCSYLTSVNIPSTVTTIGDRVFASCSKLPSISLPEGLDSIGYKAFSGCSKLTSITIPSTVTAIGEKAFESCTGLRSITCLAPQPPTLGANVFYCINKFPVIVVVPKNSRALYLADDQWNDFSTIVGMTDMCGDHLFWTLQDSVLTISGTGAMYNFTATDSVPWIPLHANEIAHVVIQDGVTDIGPHAFSQCSNLRFVSIPQTVKAIGLEAFFFCRKLSSVNLPDSLTTIGDYAFADCSGLTSVAIPQGVTTISRAAFSSCSSLTSVTIPDSVTSIGDYAFGDCYALPSITLPQALKTIGKYAFAGCLALTDITIPANVTSIGNYCFNRCQNLTTFYLLNPIPFYMDQYGIGVTLAFRWEMSGQQPDFSIYVPCGTLTAYLQKKGWNGYRNQLKYQPNPDYVEHIVHLTVQDTLQGAAEVTQTIIPSACDSFVNSICTIEATAYEGYHFLRWSDGETANPRDIQLTQDTSLFAEFIGKCGENLFWNITGDSLCFYGDGDMYSFAGPAPWASQLLQLHMLFLAPEMTSIAKVAFLGATNLTSVAIPDLVTHIGAKAFMQCSELTSVSFGSLLQQMDDSAFAYCPAIQTMVSYNTTPPAVGTDAFLDVPRTSVLFVPASSVDTYRQHTVWGQFDVRPLDATAIGDSNGITASRPQLLLQNGSIYLLMPDSSRYSLTGQKLR